jgi:hypothetical protein
MSGKEGAEHGLDGSATPPQAGKPQGPGWNIGERITGIRDPKDPDGLLTLDDLPDPTGDVSDLSSLASKAKRYGDDTAR